MKTVQYTSSQLLSCARCNGEAIICVDHTLTATDQPYMTVTVASTTNITDNCGRTRYLYGLTYDEAQLADPAYSLVSTDVLGIFCKGCLTDYIDAIGAPSLQYILDLLGPYFDQVCLVTTEAEFVSAIGNVDCCHIVVGAPFTLTANRTVGVGHMLTVMKCCPITTNNHILTINGPFTAAEYQCFEITTTADVVLGSDSTDKIIPQWFGAIGDDTHDDTLAIQAAVRNSVGRVVEFPRVSSKYKIFGIINPASNSHILGQSGPIIHQTADNTQTIEILAGTTDVTIEELRFETDGVYNAGFAGRSVIDANSVGGVIYCENITIRNCDVLITPITGMGGYLARNVLMENCRIDYSTGEHGIYWRSSEDIVIVDNFIKGPGLFGACIQVTSQSGVTNISNNIIEGDGCLSYGIDFAQSGGLVPEHSVISGNLIKNVTTGIYVYANNVIVSNNIVITSSYTGIAFATSTDVTCTGNVVNEVVDAQRPGIDVDAIRATVGNNVITDCPVGIKLSETSEHVNIFSNVINHRTNAGFRGMSLTMIGTDIIPVWVYNNTVLGYITSMYNVDQYCYEWSNVCSSSQTPPAKKSSCCLTPASISVGTTDGYMRTNTAMAFQVSDGTIVHYNSTDDVWDLTALTTGVAGYAKVALCLNSVGVPAVVKGAEATTAALSKLPWILDRYAVIGYVQLPPSYAGGSLAGYAMSDFVGLQNIP